MATSAEFLGAKVGDGHLHESDTRNCHTDGAAEHSCTDTQSCSLCPQIAALSAAAPCRLYACEPLLERLRMELPASTAASIYHTTMCRTHCISLRVSCGRP